MDILKEILDVKRKEVEKLKKSFSFGRPSKKIPSKSFIKIFKKGKVALIAEIKRKSPSAGRITKRFSPSRLGKLYRKSGADAISVLTDKKFFGGDIKHLRVVKKISNLSVLRKDFLIDDVQIYQTKKINADACLLIARILDKEKLKRLVNLALKLKIEPLVEVHSGADVKKTLKTKARIIGINNRDLKTFSVDFRKSIKLIKKFPALKKRIVISESGISNRDQVETLQACGVKGILVGEAILKAKDITGKINELKIRM